MNTWSLALAGEITRGWARLYTAGLPAATGEERRGEIASDLWEHASWAGACGRSGHATAAHIFARTVLGMPSDVSWHVAELRGPEMPFGSRAIVGVAVILGALSVLMAVSLTIALLTAPWHHSEDPLFLAAVVAGLVGPFVALGGVYVLRRAAVEGDSPGRGRALIVAGTCGIAVLGGAMSHWTVVGPIIAVAIVLFWLVRIVGWSRGRAATA